MKNTQLTHTDHKATEKKFPLCFLVHDIDVPMNVGSLFRIADALGVEKIYLTGSSAVPPNPKIKKTSRSAEKYVPFSYSENPFQVVKELKEKGYKIISLEICSHSIPIDQYAASSSDKICLIPGSENHGVSQALLDISDVSVHIPMIGKNSSMNVANACSIAAYLISRQMTDKQSPKTKHFL